MNSAALDAFCRTDEVDEVVRASLAEIISRDLSRRIDEAWAEGLAAPVATTVAMHKLRTIVNLAVYPLDGKHPSQEALEVRAPDKEPAPSSIDAWARGVVPTRQKSAVDDMRFMNRVGTAESGTFSVASSFRSRKSGASGAVSNRSSGGIRPVSNGTAASGGGRRDRAGSADYDGLSDHATDERPSSHQSSRMGGAGDKTEQYRRMQKLLNRRGSSNRSMSAGKDEFRQMQEEIEATRKAMKGLRFAIDSNGKTVPITDAEPDALPKVSVAMGATITSFQEAANRDDIPEINRAPKKGLGKTSQAPLGPAFVPSTTLATVLSENIDDSFKLNPGVSVITGVSVREGPPAPADPSRPSRKKAGASDAASLASAASAHEDLDGSESLMSNNVTVQSTSSSKLADMDPMEGGKLRSHNANGSKILTDKDLGLGPVSSTGKPHPSTLPVKPSSKQRELVKDLAGGAGKAGPRDRAAPPSSVPTVERKKLAPPELGKTVGHGITDGGSVTGSKGSPVSRYGGATDNFSVGGDNSTILTGSVLSVKSKPDGGSIKLTNSELAKELY